MKKENIWFILEIICLILSFSSACYTFYIKGTTNLGFCEIMLIFALICQKIKNKKK